jgi:NADH pyrophosphatase NudC (nudix superfamily)
MATPKKGPFNRALDRAVARQAREAAERYCPKCLGTKVLYVDGERVSCQYCEVTGLRGAGPG